MGVGEIQDEGSGGPGERSQKGLSFHLRYAGWLIWSNAITVLATIQGIVATLMLNQDIFSHETFRVLVVCNAVLTAIVAQVKRNNPPGPAPERH